MSDRSAITSTLVGKLIERVNEGQLSRGAVVAQGGSIGLGDVVLKRLVDGPTVGSDDLAVVAPAGMRARSGKFMDAVGKAALIVGPGRGIDQETVEVAAGGGMYDGDGGVVYVTSAGEFFPAGAAGKATGRSTSFDKTSSFTPQVAEWIYPGAAADKTASYPTEDTKVLLFTGEYTAEEIFGERETDLPLTRVDAGATFDTADIVMAAPSGVAFEDDEATTSIKAVFTAGHPAPLYGVTFGMGVLATPNEKAAGESVNSLVGTDTKKLLETDQVRNLLGRTSVTDGDEVRWLTGPARVEVDDDLNPTVFGESVDDPGLESFAGTVAGDAGPWRVGVHVVRATLDDHLIVAASHRWPAGSAEEAGAVVEEPPVSMSRARELLAEATGRLESR